MYGLPRKTDHFTWLFSLVGGHTKSVFPKRFLDRRETSFEPNRYLLLVRELICKETNLFFSKEGLH
ncbi:hypothetical protein FHK02_6054 [Spirosoma sp. LMG 31448]|uniref:Uncharacterized protein n=1 Tax=Spirosoma utsteinense TaxID=2585773 RepID=A0ABR6WFM4_9BACT|nr:hypothetical protein [Spirosoma utsteinense]MBC3795359.1 hypothetical protein [Spirosoma utsteinense]